MIVFIKDKKTFTTKVMATAVDYEIHESIYDTVSRITIPTPKALPSEGDFVMFDGMPFIGIVTEVDIDGGETEISAEQVIKLFSRDMFYTASPYTYLEDHLKSIIDTDYTNCTDAEYKLPFLVVSALSQTTGTIVPDFEETATGNGTPASVSGTTLTLDQIGVVAGGSIYNVKSYLNKLRRLKDIVCIWSFTNTALNLDLYKKTFPVYNIDLSNPRYKINEQTFANQTVGKITAYCEDNGNYYTRYLKTDGTITSTYSTTGRVDGEWRPIIVSEYSELDNSVKDEFAQNYYSHKISFQTEADFNLYDRLNLRIGGKIFTSYVSGIIQTKGSKVRTVECGELQTQYPFLERL